MLGTKTSDLHSAWSMTSDLSELRVWMGLKTHWCYLSMGPRGWEDQTLGYNAEVTRTWRQVVGTLGGWYKDPMVTPTNTGRKGQKGRETAAEQLCDTPVMRTATTQYAGTLRSPALKTRGSRKRL